MGGAVNNLEAYRQAEFLVLALKLMGLVDRHLRVLVTVELRPTSRLRLFPPVLIDAVIRPGLE